MTESMDTTIGALEAQLNDFDAQVRVKALRKLIQHLNAGDVAVEERHGWVNVHCHSFFSYSGYGYSPTRLVWMAKKMGLDVIGLVDFDVLDGVDEFYAAGRLLQVRTVAGIETRAYVPECADKEINSPGEPGVTYHMGSAFPNASIPAAQQAFADRLRNGSRQRNEAMIAKINPVMSPVNLRYEHDVLVLAPSGNATERHICQAYETKAIALFPHDGKRAQYWADRLGGEIADYADMDSVTLQGRIRSKTMKAGCVGYQQPNAETFPLMRDMNAHTVALGGIPTLAWLDGTRAGEEVDALLDLHQDAGSVAINIVPDRNWNIQDAAQKKIKLQHLYDIVAKADERGMPVQVGTEMNAPGLKFVDDFDVEELAPVRASFERGAYIMYGHVVEQTMSGNGYVGAWADEKFSSVAEKNSYFEKLGRAHSCLPAATAG